MALTSLALAITVSVWLVPPYFILMVWILAPAQGPRDSASAPLAPGSQQDSDAESESLCEPAELEIGLRSQAEPAVIASSPSETAAIPDEGNVPLPVAVKTKRGKGRGRKAKGAPVVEPTVATATWIQVGPGKFVRVETPSENAPTEPVLVSAVSESESTSPPSPALPASEAVEELVPQELAAEVHSEPEDRPAIIDELAVCDELAEEEPITDDVPSSPDAEAWLRPSAEEEAVLPEEELAPLEFAVEVSPEREESSTALNEPVAGDEFPQEEPITDDVPSSPDAEALLGLSPEEDGVLEEELVPEDRAVEHRWESEDRSAILDDPAACGEFYAEEPITDDVPPSPDAEAWLRPSEEEAALWEEELAPAEFAVEASPEREDASVILEEPAVDDEDAQEEPITDDAPTSPDAEASLWPTPEEVLESAFEGSPGDVAEVAVPRELAVEARSELEDCSAIFEEPAAHDESIQDEWVAVTDCAEASPDVEACPQAWAEQGVGPVPDHSPDFELHHDEPYVDEGACQDASAAHESDVVDVESEEGSGTCGEVAAESVPEASRLEDHELGPVESSGDQGIALDALDVGWTTELADPPFEEAGSVPSPSLRAVTVSPRSTGSVPFVSWRGVWPRVGPAAGRSSGPRPSRRVVRSGPTVRVSPGFRRRTRRGVGSYRLVCRTFPPRSPPSRGTLHRLETGRGVRERG